MNKTIYKQADARWGSKPYPTKSSTFAGCGCGCCSCTHILLEFEKYKKYTPESLRPYMVKHGYAVAHQGTTHAGIGATLLAYGIKNKEVATMKNLFEALDQADQKLGILLFKGGTKGGITGTTGGHYVAFTNYKIKDGRHYFYVKDSGGRNHDGWYCYETQMQGLVYKAGRAWSDLTPYTPAKKSVYSGQYPSAPVSVKSGTKTNIKYWQQFLNWWGGYDLVVDGIFGAATKQHTIDFQREYGLEVDGICGKKTIAKAKKIGKTEKH